MRKTYNEKEVLKNYVLGHFYHLFTVIERFGFKAVMAEEKARRSGPKMSQMLINHWGARNNPDVVKALSKGHEAFREALFQRLMDEHSKEIEINRCPKCNRVVRTPKAKQCQWCFHQWH